MLNRNILQVFSVHDLFKKKCVVFLNKIYTTVLVRPNTKDKYEASELYKQTIKTCVTIAAI